MGIVRILLSLLLLALSVIGADSFIIAKVPASKKYIDKLVRYRAVIGFAGIVVSVACLLQWFAIAHFAGLASGPVLFALVAILLTLVLGFVFGLSYIRDSLKDPNAPFLLKAEGFRIKLLPFQQQLSLAGLVVGIISLFLMF
jgi:hypothetical protein